MLETILTSFAFKIAQALAAFFIARAGLAHLDKRLGFSFKEWLGNASPEAVSLYLGLRILAVCLLVGLIVS